MEAERRLKANLKVAGKPCGWCQEALALGDDAALCAACGKEHHGRCWDGHAGCSTEECAAAPLRRLDSPGKAVSPPGLGAFAPAAHDDLDPGMMRCPRCRVSIAIALQVCPACKAITSPDGIYRGLKTNAPGAVAALVCGIIGILVCGIVLGPIAIVQSAKAKQAMTADPRLGGEGLATAGLVLGILDIVVFVLLMAVQVSRR